MFCLNSLKEVLIYVLSELFILVMSNSEFVYINTIRLKRV